MQPGRVGKGGISCQELSAKVLGWVEAGSFGEGGLNVGKNVGRSFVDVGVGVGTGRWGATTEPTK